MSVSQTLVLLSIAYWAGIALNVLGWMTSRVNLTLANVVVGIGVMIVVITLPLICYVAWKPGDTFSAMWSSLGIPSGVLLEMIMGRCRTAVCYEGRYLLGWVLAVLAAACPVLGFRVMLKND